jgi:hypothetical protein
VYQTFLSFFWLCLDTENISARKAKLTTAARIDTVLTIGL